MFAVMSVIASCAPGVSTCDDQSIARQIAITSFVLVVLVVSVAWLVHRGSNE